MLAKLTTQLKSFLGSEVAGAHPGDDLRSLLADVTLLTLVESPRFATAEWLDSARAILNGQTTEEVVKDILVQIFLAEFAAQVHTLGEISDQDLQALAGALAGAINTLESVGAVEAAAIGQLVAGHFYLYVRHSLGFRSYFLEQAEKYFAAADNPDCPVIGRAFAKLRLGDTQLLGIQNPDSAVIATSDENFFDALEILSKLTADFMPAAVARIGAEVRVALGTTSYLLSQIGGEQSQKMREVAIDHLASVIGKTSELPVGSERWSKAALVLARAWGAEADARALIASETGAQGEAFEEAMEVERLVLGEIVANASNEAPEVWALAHLALAATDGLRPSSATRQKVISHYEIALSVFDSRACPETWAKVEGQLGTFLLNEAMLQDDPDGKEASLQHFVAASQVDDPLRDTERNAARQLAHALINLGRLDEALSALAQAMDAGEYVLARALSVPAQRAESGILASIVRELAQLLIQTGKTEDALRFLVYAIELDFAYSLRFPPRSPDESEQLDRILLGTTQKERIYNAILPFARTEYELNAVRREAGERLGPIVESALEERRRFLDNSLEKISLKALIPAGGVLAIPLASSDGNFIVLSENQDVPMEVVPATDVSRRWLLEAVFGAGLREGWLSAYLRSLIERTATTDLFGGHPAIVESRDRVLTVTYLPGLSEDPAGTIPQEKWIPALDESARAAWHIIEPLLRHLNGRLPPGSPVVFMGEPLLAMLPLAAAWRHVSGTAKVLAEDWSIGTVPAASLFRSKGSDFKFDPEDASLVVVDPTASLPFARWEYVALVASQPGLQVRMVGERPSAIKKAVIEAFGDSSIQHFACHAQYENGDPLDSFINLGGGEKLTAREIVSELDLSKSKLVVLSACESGMVNTAVTNPERYVGLATAFLEAGAQRVIASLWSVNDISTMLLMHAFYEELAEKPPIIALRNAQLRIRDMTASKTAAALQFLEQRGAEMPRSPSERQRRTALEAQIARFSALPKNAQPFMHAYHWAAFVHYGAPR
jgi:CHAT domain-containing protein/tetratricopeptide (TPR) repeat protein